MGDWMMGALALVRFEGWPIIIVYMALRKSWWALTATWGMLLIGAIEVFELVQPYAASTRFFSPTGMSSTKKSQAQLEAAQPASSHRRSIRGAMDTGQCCAALQAAPVQERPLMILLMVLSQCSNNWLVAVIGRRI